MSATKHWLRGGIVWKLTGLVLGALFASFVVTSCVSIWLDLNRQATLETDRLTQTARVIGSLAAESVAAGDRRGAFLAVRSVSQMPDISYARLETPVALLAETGGGARLLRDADITEGGRLSLWAVLTTGSIQVTAPVVNEGATVGSITLFSRVPELRSRVAATVWTSLAGALVAVIAGLAVAMRMARQISRPIVELAGLVRRVHATQDFRSDLAIKADGEIADLVNGFDVMMAGIRDRDARIADHVENLENQVEHRTAELVVARDAADRANEAKSDFLAVMSHEIRTPLNGILALGDMLAKSDLPQRQQRYADVISKSGQSLLSIINDILDFSKVEAGKMELESVPVDLVEVAEDVASLFSEKAVSKGLDLAVYVDPRLGRIVGDPTRLRQIVGNLVNNAIKFTEAGGVLIAIECDPDGRIRISVEDTGPGIPAETLPRLFDAFSQADQSTSRKYGGTGLGLAICDRLVRSMEGQWDLKSTLGQGSTFAFTAPFDRIAGDEAPVALPTLKVRIAIPGRQTTEATTRYLCSLGVEIAPEGDVPAITGPAASPPGAVIVCDDEAAAAAVLAARSQACCLVKPLRRADLFNVLSQLSRGEAPMLDQARSADQTVVMFPGVRVLVVDDSEVNREVATEALAQLGIDADTAADGLQAVEILRSRPYDLVLMDGSMPELDGFEATRLIRAEEAQSGRPRAAIVALTAHVVGSGADAWKTCGMDGVIHKPFRVPDLVRELTRHCGAFARSGYSEPGAASVATGPSTEMFDPVVRGDLLGMLQAGKRDFVERVQTLYADHAPLRLADAVTAAESGDLDALARAAHALKSMSLSLGAAGVARQASAIEATARDGVAATTAAMAKLAESVTETMAAMAADLESGGSSPATMAERLSAGLSAGHLELAYQALVDRSGAPAGKVEALIRWVDPIEGRMAPDAFVPELERSGGIEILTDFVLARACRDMRERGVVVSVNASAAEFQKAGFADRVLAAAKAADYPLERLEIEVTETALLDIAAARRTIDALAEHGVGVALDDFGAGYTSLHALRELKFRTLKIDKSLVDGCCHETASAAIIHAVIGVGRALGMKVVCEGVETAEQAVFLRIAGAHYMQGYHFHRPVAVEGLPAVLEAA
jgi:signal transduction histidine kinase/EAL domain-containing protein (putative c-di-GMP-specific phosphodiesterase class I)/CheY-like chemotaxis protein